MSRLRNLLGRVQQYVTHDLREIIAPSSLPNPPGYVPPPKIPILRYFKVAGESVREYIESWDSEKLRQKLRERHGVDPFEQEVQATKKELKSLVDEFGEAVRGGTPALKPFLQNLWNTRAVAYRDALQQFIVGYKEGFQEANKPDIPPEVAQDMQQGQRSPGQQPTEQSEQPQPGQQNLAVGHEQGVQLPPLQHDVQKAASGRQAEKDLTDQEVQPGKPQQGVQDQHQRQRQEQ